MSQKSWIGLLIAGVALGGAAGALIPWSGTGHGVDSFRSKVEGEVVHLTFKPTKERYVILGSGGGAEAEEFNVPFSVERGAEITLTKSRQWVVYKPIAYCGPDCRPCLVADDCPPIPPPPLKVGKILMIR